MRLHNRLFSITVLILQFLFFPMSLIHLNRNGVFLIHFVAGMLASVFLIEIMK